jgi:hypothetical protein
MRRQFTSMARDGARHGAKDYACPSLCFVFVFLFFYLGLFTSMALDSLGREEMAGSMLATAVSA